MAESILGLIEQEFLKLETRLLLPLYKQCREVAKEKDGKNTLYCAKVVPLFEQRLKQLGIKLNNDNYSGSAGILTQWYMSIRFSWVFHIDIVRDNKRIYKEVFDAPGNITAREFLTHMWNTLKAWNKSLANNTATTSSTQPVRPVQPTRPTQPVRPVQPARPVQPVRPTQPVKPAQPARPVQPTRPAQPARPVQPAKSVVPPVIPAEPFPEEPKKPVRPANPSKPVQPETPAPAPPEPPKRIELGDIAQAEAQNDELMDLLLENLGEDEN